MQCWCDEIQVCSVEKRIWFTKGEECEEAKKEFIESSKILEGELSDKPYFGGKTFGFVDIALITFYSRFYSFEMFGKFSIEAEFPKIIAWARRCIQKDTSHTTAKSLPNQKKVYEFRAVETIETVCYFQRLKSLKKVFSTVKMIIENCH